MDDAKYGSKQGIRLADISENAIMDLTCQESMTFSLPDGTLLDADFGFRFDEEVTVDWTAIQHLLEQPGDTLVNFEEIEQKWQEDKQYMHTWLKCVVADTGTVMQLQQPTPTKAKHSWAGLIKGETTKLQLQIQGTLDDDLVNAVTLATEITCTHESVMSVMPVMPVVPVIDVLAVDVASGDCTEKSAEEHEKVLACQVPTIVVTSVNEKVAPQPLAIVVDVTVASESGDREHRGHCTEKSTEEHEKSLACQSPMIATTSVDEKDALPPLAVQMVETVLQGGPQASEIVYGQSMTFAELIEMMPSQNCWQLVGKKGKTTLITSPLDSETKRSSITSKAKRGGLHAGAKRLAKALKAKVAACFGQKPRNSAPVAEGEEPDAERADSDTLSFADSPRTAARREAEETAAQAESAAKAKAAAAAKAKAAAATKAPAARHKTAGAAASTSAAGALPQQVAGRQQTQPATGAGDSTRAPAQLASIEGAAAATQQRELPPAVDDALEECIQRTKQDAAQQQPAKRANKPISEMNVAELEQAARHLAKQQTRHIRKAEKAAAEIAEAQARAARLQDPDTIMDSPTHEQTAPAKQSDRHVNDGTHSAGNPIGSNRGGRGRSQPGRHHGGPSRGQSANAGKGIKRGHNPPQHNHNAKDHSNKYARLFAKGWNQKLNQKLEQAAETYHAQSERRDRESKKRKAQRGRNSCHSAEPSRNREDRNDQGPPPGFEHLRNARAQSVNTQRCGGQGAAPLANDSENADAPVDSEHEHAREHGAPDCTVVGSLRPNKATSTGDPVYDKQVSDMEVFRRRLHAIEFMRELQPELDALERAKEKWGYLESGTPHYRKRKYLRNKIRNATQVIRYTETVLDIPPWNGILDLRDMACGCQTDDSEDDAITVNKKQNEMQEMVDLTVAPVVTDQAYGVASTNVAHNDMDACDHTRDNHAPASDCHDQLAARHKARPAKL